MDNRENETKSVTEKVAEVAEKVQKVKKTIKRVRWLSVLIPSPMVLLWGLVIFIIIIVALAPVVMWGEIKEKVANTTEKLLNFVTTLNWDNNEGLFFSTLEKAYNDYNSFPDKEGELDVTLIAATIHYKKMVPIAEHFEEEMKLSDSERSDYTEGDNSPVIPVNQMRSFYRVANSKLGEINGSSGKILSELVGAKVIMKCYPTGDNIFSTVDSAVDWLSSTGETIFKYSKTKLKQVLQSMNIVGNTINEFANMYAYSKENESYLKQKYLELVEGRSFLEKAIQNSDLSVNCGEGEMALPTIFYFMDYDNYRRYLKEIYLPIVIATELRGKNNEEKENNLNEAVELIFSMRDTVDNLLQGKGLLFGGSKEPVFHIGGSDGFAILFPDGTNFVVTSGYGLRRHPVTGEPDKMHNGIDLAGSGIDGTPILAPAPGVVIAAGFAGTAGYRVTLSHDLDGDGNIDYYTKYMHMRTNSISVSVGQEVISGQKLGEVGSTGSSTGSHLHFEILNSSNVHLDPTGYIGYFVSNNTRDTDYSEINAD